MFFSRSLVATVALCMSLALHADAHAAIAPAMGVAGTPVRKDAQRPSTANPCGKVNIAQTIDSSTAAPADASGVFAATITNFNAGVDGSTLVTAKVDATGTGKSFVDAQVLQNGVKAPTSTGSVPLSVQLPAGTTCTGGATGNKCLVSFTTAGKFGNCVVVSQGAAGTGAAAANGTDTTAAAAGTGNAAAAGTGNSTTAGTTGTGKGKGKKGAAKGTAAAAGTNAAATGAAAAGTDTTAAAADSAAASVAATDSTAATATAIDTTAATATAIDTTAAAATSAAATTGKGKKHHKGNKQAGQAAQGTDTAAATATDSTAAAATDSAAAAATDSTVATATDAAAAAATSAATTAATGKDKAALVDRLRKFVQAQRQNRAAGTRRARIARRAAEGPAVEVLA